MVLPSQRWFLVAAILAFIAPVALIWPAAGAGLLVLDGLWLLALAIDASRVMGFKLADLTVGRAAPPAFSVGRALPVSYDWRHSLRSPLKVLVREEFPAPLEIQGEPTRALVIPPGDGFRETITLLPRHRGKSEAGTLTLRILAPWGLAWRQARKPLPWHPDGLSQPGRRLDAFVADSGPAATGGGISQRAAARRGKGFREPEGMGAGRGYPDYRLEGDGAARQGDGKAIRRRTETAGPDRDRRRTDADRRSRRRAAARERSACRTPPRAQRGGP